MGLRMLSMCVLLAIGIGLSVKNVNNIHDKNAKIQTLSESLFAMQTANDDLMQAYEELGMQYMTVEATAYLCKDERENRHHGITASGAPCKPGVSIAVDPNVIPIGSFLRVNGKWMIAQDTGNLIKGNKIDIAVSSRYEAESFGRRTLNVIVLGE